MAPGVHAEDPRLGRVARFDPRSRQYPIRELVGDKRPRSYTWRLDILLNQLKTPRCTGYSTAHEIAARPVPRIVTAADADEIYFVGQKNDQWAGEDYAGGSVLGAMQAGQLLGFYGAYRWAFGLEDAVLAVGYHGPVVLGINWYQAMFRPDVAGRLEVGGHVAGGHAILCNRVDVRRERAWLVNSWGVSWGLNGGAWLSFPDLARLLREDGECAVPVTRLAGAAS